MKEAKAFTVPTVFEQTWLNRYPWPTEIVFDRGCEFMGEFTTMYPMDID
jgi:hypothetical protein